jgi:hypothetical protein
MTTLRQAAERARYALKMAVYAHGKMLLTDPPQEAWKAWNVEGVIREALAALDAALAQDDEDTRCPTCGEDGGTSCGMPNCGLLTGGDEAQEPVKSCETCKYHDTGSKLCHGCLIYTADNWEPRT